MKIIYTILDLHFKNLWEQFRNIILVRTCLLECAPSSSPASLHINIIESQQQESCDNSQACELVKLSTCRARISGCGNWSRRRGRSVAIAGVVAGVIVGVVAGVVWCWMVTIVDLG